jgi:hypothetical protein
MDKLSFLDGVQAPDQVAASADAPVNETQVSSPPDAEVAEAAVESPVADVGAQADQPGAQAHVPIIALLDERERRQAAERELEALRAQAAPPPQPEIPDPYSEPEAFAAFQAERTQYLVLNAKLDVQEEAQRERHGDEVVDAAKKWVEARTAANPSFFPELMSQRNPWAYAVEQYKRDSAVSSIDTSELEAFRAWKQAQTDIAQPQATTPAPSPTLAKPPKSIASLPAAGGVAHVATGPGVAFDSFFSG